MITPPLSTTPLDEADCRLPETDFFMPSLLRSVPPSELESSIPLLILFSSDLLVAASDVVSSAAW